MTYIRLDVRCVQSDIQGPITRLCYYAFTFIVCSSRMGLVNRIKGTPFHGDKILTTMLRRAPLAFMYRVNFHASGLSPFERVHERNSNAHTFCLIMHQVSFPFERVSKRPTNVSILFHFRSNAFTNAIRT